MDLDRVGIYGGSWGGYFALRGMLTAPDVFHVGVAVCPGDLTEAQPINEPYMGLPEDNPEGYAAFDLNARAKDLSGRLLLVHGTYDDNVHPANAWQFVESLVQAGKDFDMMMYPMRKHGIADRAARIHLFRKMREHWREHL